MSKFKNKFLSILSILIFVACNSSNDARGLKKIKLNRDTCTRCTMTISDPRYISQVVMPKVTKAFDDVGCAVHWIKENKITKFKIYVKDIDTNKYINAKTAYYSIGTSPMGYNFAAHKIKNKKNKFTYDEMSKIVKSKR